MDMNKLKYICIIKYKNGFYYKYIPFCYSIVINKEFKKWIIKKLLIY